MPQEDQAVAVNQLVQVGDDFVKDVGFTISGKKHFDAVVGDYIVELKNRTMAYADADKAIGMQREATHDHVRLAARFISGSSKGEPKNEWAVAAQVGEYLCTAVAGAGAGHLDKSIGILAFGVSIALGIAFHLVRFRRS